MPHLNIRPAHLTHDLEALKKLTAQLGYLTSFEQLKQRIENLQQDPKYTTWVAEYQKSNYWLCWAHSTIHMAI